MTASRRLLATMVLERRQLVGQPGPFNVVRAGKYDRWKETDA
jgi:hypothetical protein